MKSGPAVRRKPAPDFKVVAWKWGSMYGPDHVHRLRNMVARHLRLDHEFVLITDNAAGIDPSIRVIPLWNDLKDEGYCMRRLKAFMPEMREIIGPRFVWLDLDIVIVGDVTPLFDCAADFKISGVELRPQPYNGSIVLMNAGARPQVFRDYDRSRHERARTEKRYGGSDQRWIAEILGENEETWTEADGIYNWRDHIAPEPPDGTGGALPENARIIVMNSRIFDPSRADCQAKAPWILDHWK